MWKAWFDSGQRDAVGSDAVARVAPGCPASFNASPAQGSLPIPYISESDKLARLGVCYVDVEVLPAKLREWLRVNPRTPKWDKKENLRGPVAKKIVRTLEDEPEMMCVRSNGLMVLVDDMEFQRAEAGRECSSLA